METIEAICTFIGAIVLIAIILTAIAMAAVLLLSSRVGGLTPKETTEIESSTEREKGDD